MFFSGFGGLIVLIIEIVLHQIKMKRKNIADNNITNKTHNRFVNDNVLVHNA